MAYQITLTLTDENAILLVDSLNWAVQEPYIQLRDLQPKQPDETKTEFGERIVRQIIKKVADEGDRVRDKEERYNRAVKAIPPAHSELPEGLIQEP